MIPDLRRRFNAAFTPERYRQFLASTEARAGCRIRFRQSETPCFFEKTLLDRLAQAGRELLDQLLSNPSYLDAARAVVPPEFNVPGEHPHPLFVQADFGLIRANGAIEPRLVEIQGFPSLYAYQPLLARQYIESYRLDGALGYCFTGDYAGALRRAVLGEHAPENVVLLEIDPENQKTLPDFRATRDLLGIPYVSITKVRKQGRKLYYGDVPIHRVYNRVIVDELVRLDVKPPFDYRDDLDVEWAGHPNWFFLLSKFSIPYLRHDTVPATRFLHQIDRLPGDLDNYVLKQLFSFAGLGVIVGPSREQIESIPAAQRSQYILQERVRFEPVIDTPHGATQAEIRVMYIWLDELKPVTTLIRMGRGKMMGVDHNRDLEWVGASAALFPREA